MYRKSLDKGLGGGIKIFRRKNFVSQCRKVRRGIFYCSINFGYRKSLDGRGGNYQDFPSKIFLSYSAETLPRESFTVALTSGIEKVWIKGGSIKSFRRKKFVSQCGNFP